MLPVEACGVLHQALQPMCIECTVNSSNVKLAACTMSYAGASKEGVAPSVQPASKRAKVDKPARQPKKSTLVQASMPALFQREPTKYQVISGVLHTPPSAHQQQPSHTLSSLLCCQGARSHLDRVLVQVMLQ